MEAPLIGSRAVRRTSTGPVRRRAPPTGPMTLMVSESSESTSARSDTGRKIAPKAVALKVSASLQAVNLFTKPLMMSDDGSLRDGRYKTFAFAAIFGIVAIVLVAVYATRQTVFQQTAYKPTLAQFDGFVAKGWAPVCSCSKPPTFADAVQLNVPAFANFTTNVCASLVGLANYFNANLTFTQTNTAALLYFYVLRPLAYICTGERLGTNLGLREILPLEIGPSILDEPALTSLAVNSMVAHIDTGFQAGGQALSQVSLGAYLPPLLRTDMSWGALSRSPENCSCNPVVVGGLPPLQAMEPCSFLAAFDTRNASDPDVRSTWTCSLERNLWLFPLSLLLQDAFYEQFGVPPEVYQPLQRFPLSENVTATTPFGSYVAGAVSAYFTGPPNAWNYAVLQPGVLTITYDRYFAACAPNSCVVTYSDTPSAIQLITIMLGVISGLQTVLMLSVDRGYDWLCKAWCDRRALAASNDKRKKRVGSSCNGDDDADDSDEDRDGGDGASVRPAHGALDQTVVLTSTGPTAEPQSAGHTTGPRPLPAACRTAPTPHGNEASARSPPSG